MTENQRENKKTAELQPLRIPTDPLDIFFEPPPGLSGGQRSQFGAMLRDIKIDIEPQGFIEHQWCRVIGGHCWRIIELQTIREHFINSRWNDALAEILIGYTNLDVLDLIDRMQRHEKSAEDAVNEMRSKFAISDDQIRSTIEIRYHDKLSKIDQQIRSSEVERDRVIEQIERRRFLRHANARLDQSRPASRNHS